MAGGGKIRYLSVCSGIEAASVAWEPLGWEPAGFSEIEPFPCAVLKHRFPNVTNYGDMTKFKEWKNVGAVDVLVGGTPCQSFSTAGLRKGLADPRGNLMLTFGAIAAHFRPRWLIWENVPGVLSSHGGRDFGTFLGMLAELGYGFAYRVCNAEFWGVAQRRRRVFVVGYLGDWRPPAAVLFESEGLSGNIKKGKKAVGGAAGGVSAGAPQYYENHMQDSRVTGPHDIATSITAKYGTGGGNLPLVLSSGQTNAEVMHEKCPALTCLHEQPILAMANDNTNAETRENTMPTLRARQKPFVMVDAHDPANLCLMDQGGDIMNIEHGKTGTLRADANGHQPIIMQESATGVASYGNQVVALNEKQPTLRTTYPGIAVSNLIARYLTPVECERLQGFPDNHVRIPYRGKPAEQCPKSPRYKALGNSMAVPVMRWIGERVVKVEKTLNAQALANKRRAEIEP